MSDQISQARREAWQAGVDDALAERGPGVRGQVSGDGDLQRQVRELTAAVAALRVERTQVPVSQVKSVRLRLAESDLLAGIVDSPRTSLLGVLLGVAAAAQYLDPGILGEFVHLLEGQGDSGAFGLAVAALSLLLGRYGQAKAGPAGGSIEAKQ